MLSLSIKNLENVIGAERQEPENSERTNLRANLPLLSPLWITCYLLLVTPSRASSRAGEVWAVRRRHHQLTRTTYRTTYPAPVRATPNHTF
ncbi:hypothetical protein RRG08_032646 [Elysia crispata]|uniref:Uncharacterized protein n=1 Tax=Elysia crispata TaxID=231223 RepID=A0AAE0XZP8_9GAST|nr:hypothetical protein RRG08_032646 [Elysia crispata]